MSLCFTVIDILSPLTDITAVEGTKAVMEAKISAADVTSVKWYHNDKLVMPSERIQMLAKGSKQHLVFHRTFATDEGTYKLCVGKADSSCKLTIESMFFYCVLQVHSDPIYTEPIQLILLFYRNSYREAYGGSSLHRDPEYNI